MHGLGLRVCMHCRLSVRIYWSPHTFRTPEEVRSAHTHNQAWSIAYLLIANASVCSCLVSGMIRTGLPRELQRQLHAGCKNMQLRCFHHLPPNAHVVLLTRFDTL